MAKTIVNRLQFIPGADIWCCEAGNNHLYLGIVEWKKGNYQFVRTVLPTRIAPASSSASRAPWYS